MAISAANRSAPPSLDTLSISVMTRSLRFAPAPDEGMYLHYGRADTMSGGATRQARRCGESMRIAYIVSRFPHVSETFIVRELNALSALDAIEIELFHLFPSR